MMRPTIIGPILLALFLTACGGVTTPETAVAPALAETPAAVSATDTPSPEATSTDTVVAIVIEVQPTEPPVEPTLAPAATVPPDPPTPLPAALDWLASVGRTEDNLMFLGNPAAPVTLTDYSDFL
jgi:hypothetical protein